jgi:hypothetical protein
MHRFPDRRIALHDAEQHVLSLEEAGGMGGENPEAGTQLDRLLDRHPCLHALDVSLRRDLLEQGSWLIQRSDPDRPLSKKRIGQAREGNLK